MALSTMGGYAEALKEVDDIIRIYIGDKGPDSIPFLVPKSILCRQFRYFKKALSSNSKEGNTGILHFPEDNKEAWTILLCYLFRGKVVTEDGDGIRGEGSPADAYFLALTHGYILGNKYELGAFQNGIMRAFIESLRGRTMTPECVVEILNLLPAESLLQKPVLEEVVMTVESYYQFNWKAFKEIATDEEVFLKLMGYFREHARGHRSFPAHAYGQYGWNVKWYFVKEEEEAED